MASLCLHCEAPDPKVGHLICVDCAGDATFRRMVFSEYRFLVPGEKIVLGTETRTDRAHDDWHRTPLGDLVPPDAFGMFRRRVRLAGDGCRFLDLGEPLNGSDEVQDERDDWVSLSTLHGGPYHGGFIGRLEENPNKYRRQMFARFSTGCACPERIPIRPTKSYGSDTVVVHDPPEDASPEELERLFQEAAARQAEPPTVCTTCGRVWAVLAEGQLPETEYPAGSEPDPTCPCDQVEALDKPKLGRGLQMPPLGELRDLITQALDGRDTGELVARVRCVRCGQVFTAEAWNARRAVYPDLAVDRPRDALGVPPEQIRRGEGPPYLRPTSPRQLEALQRVGYQYELVRWKRFRDRASRLFGEDTVRNIDASFDEVEHLVRQRATGAREAKDAKEPLLLADTDAVLALIHEQLDRLSLYFQEEGEKALDRRLELLNTRIQAAGGRPFYRLDAAPEPPEPADLKPAERAALDKVAGLLAPIVATGHELRPESMSLDSVLLRFIELTGLALKRACDEHKNSDDPEVKALAAELAELISPYELDDTSIAPTLSPDIVEAVTPEKPKKSLLRPKLIPYLVLPPEMEIRPGDFWEDHDTEVTDYGDADEPLPRWESPLTKKHHKLRPCVSTVGRKVPWPPDLPREGEEIEVNGKKEKAGARRAVSPFRRALEAPFPEQFLLPPDPFKEHQMLCRFGGLDEPLPTRVDEVTAGVTWPKEVKVKDLEKVLRALYEAAGMNVQSLAIDEKLKVVRLVLSGADGNTRSVAVPLPPEVTV